MNFLLLVVFFARLLTGIATPHAVSNDRAETLHTISKASLSGRDLPDGELSDLLWPESGDISNGDSDTILFPESDDTLPALFDQASATGCGDSQSSLDLFTDSSTLVSRDFIDNFPGLRDSVTPLNQLKDQACPAPNSQQSGPGNGGGQDPKPNPEPNKAPLLPESEEFDLESGKCYKGDYKYPLCCEEGTDGVYAYGCWLYRLSLRCNVPAWQFCCKEFVAVMFRGEICIPVRWPEQDLSTDNPNVPRPGNMYHIDEMWGSPGFRGD